MKKLFVVTGFLFLSGYAIGQGKVGTAELKKTVTHQIAALIYLPYSPEVLKKALSNYLSQISEGQQQSEKGYLLSSNTLIVKNYKSGGEMHFVIGLEDQSNTNQSVIYLKLNPPTNYEHNGQTALQFDMQNAKDYFDNLTVVIKPYASELQQKLQQKNLLDDQAKNTSLIKEGNRLEEKRKNIKIRMDENENYKRDKTIARRKAKNDILLDNNIAAQLNLNNEIAKQIVALSLLNKVSTAKY